MGDSTACALTAAGAVVCWGENGFGQLGNGSQTPSPVPVRVTGLTSGVISLSVGYDSACAVTAGGAVVCWGSNNYGQLGNGSADASAGTMSTVPVQVTGLTSGATSVSIGGYTACALTAAGGVECWGLGAQGQLGNGTMPMDSPVPVQVTGLTSGVTSVSVGEFSGCALSASGGLSCWGPTASARTGTARTSRAS